MEKLSTQSIVIIGKQSRGLNAYLSVFHFSLIFHISLINRMFLYLYLLLDFCLPSLKKNLKIKLCLICNSEVTRNMNFGSENPNFKPSNPNEHK